MRVCFLRFSTQFLMYAYSPEGIILLKYVSLYITNPQSGPKSMQDGWCGDDMPLPGNRPTGWEEEEDVEIGMWNSNSSQELNSSLNWPPYTKKMSSKVNISRAKPLKL